MNNINPAKFILGDFALSSENNKIKLGYFSADFREHAVSYLMAELFERHDKSKFELIGFNYGPLDNSLLHKRISSAFDKFLNVQNLSDLQIAKLSREMHIDIAIDLTGITNDGREGVFSYRAAPLQISYLGYLGTMGINYYDYLIADKSIIPEVYQKHYVEKIIYLPSYQVNDNNRDISNRIFTRKELNLTENGFVFCCLNSSFKITAKMFDVWIDILKAVPNSVLLLLAPNPWVQDNLKNEAEIRGFDFNRLVFCNYLKQDEYLARYKCVDLFLDTFPYNAGTTASDVLRIGVPILTLSGESFASRVASSVLTSMNLGDLVAHNLDQYANIAIELATNPLKFKAIKTKLMDRKLSSSLYDTKKFTSNIEKAFCKVYERYKLNLPVEHIYIE
jgi:predicted O-linked N-acetylglucosamine transferase (SPINDLY family)